VSRPKADRRGQPRAKAVTGLTVGAGPDVVGVQVKDISLSGLSFRVNQPVAFMTRLAMTLFFPPMSDRDGGARSHGHKIQGEGAVVRCEPIADRIGQHEVAVFFTYLDDTARKVIEEYVKAYLEIHAEH